MKELPLTLKERLKELIGDATVQAAVFHTFNFNPKFFENYIMPLLVPGQQFSNSAIVNNYVWRTVFRDGKMPPVTVYFDQYAKSTENGPMLPYVTTAVSMQKVGRNKGNFHPKLSFILVKNSQDQQQLIVLTGSNNLTQGGWCENRESVSEMIFTSNKYLPELLVREVQKYVTQCVDKFSRSYWSVAELELHKFLNQRGLTKHKYPVFYHSFRSSFQQFLEENVFALEEIRTVEVFSPFFLGENSMVSYFRNKGITVRMQAPFLGEYCMMKPEVFATYKEAGAEWHKSMGDRNEHSKVYRFHGNEYVYTIVGSVNFTAPAWCGELPRKVYNIESAVLNRQARSKGDEMLTRPMLDMPLKFDASEDQENKFMARQDAPPFEFLINWTGKFVSWKGRSNNRCTLELPGGIMQDLASTSKIVLDKTGFL